MTCTDHPFPALLAVWDWRLGIQNHVKSLMMKKLQRLWFFNHQFWWFSTLFTKIAFFYCGFSYFCCFFAKKSNSTKKFTKNFSAYDPFIVFQTKFCRVVLLAFHFVGNYNLATLMREKNGVLWLHKTPFAQNVGLGMV